MSHTIRVDGRRGARPDGRARRGAGAPRTTSSASLGAATGGRATSTRRRRARRRRGARRLGLVDGVTAGDHRAGRRPGAARSARTSRASTLFAADPGAHRRLRRRSTARRRDVSLGELRPGEVYLNEEAADELRVGAGRPRARLRRRPSRRSGARARRRRASTAPGPTDAAVLMPLDAGPGAARPTGRRSSTCSSPTAATRRGRRAHRRGRRAARSRSLGPLGLEVARRRSRTRSRTPTRRATRSCPSSRPSARFSIAAGILLIFLIFVMLAAERRGELGIARAIGTRRGHLVQMFIFEGARVRPRRRARRRRCSGVAVAFGMVAVMARAFDAAAEDELRDRVRRDAAEPRHRLRARRAADARRSSRSPPGG